MGYTWGWYVVSPWSAKGQTNLAFLLSGLGWTVSLALCAIAVSVVLGLAIALLGLAKHRLVRGVSRVYVEALRSIPMLVMVLWVFYGLPVVLGITLDVFAAGVVALALCDSAFEAEIFRAGIQSIERGQWDGARALGMRWGQAMRRIILPQALKRMTPALTNRAIEIFKMSTLASAVAYVELLQQAKLIASLNFNPIEAYSAVAVIFFVFLWPLVQFTYLLERRLKRDE